MDRHVYSRRFKGNVNVSPVRVDNRVFSSLFDAETYCTAQGYDPDQKIQYEDTPEFVQECQHIAKFQLAILDEVSADLDKRLNKLKAESAAAWSTYEAAMKNRDLLSEHYRQVALEIGAKIQECYQSHDMVSQIKEGLYHVTNWYK